jgi:hypothetical protein
MMTTNEIKIQFTGKDGWVARDNDGSYVVDQPWGDDPSATDAQLIGWAVPFFMSPDGATDAELTTLRESITVVR